MNKKYILLILIFVLIVFGGWFILFKDKNETNINLNEDLPQNKITKLKDIKNPDLVFDLDLSGQKLDSFPDEIFNLIYLKKLNLADNQISFLPPEINRLTNLEEFNMENNQLSGTLPAEIGAWKKLKVLDVSGNNLTGIPAEIGNLAGLATLDYNNNKLTSLPQEIENLTGLRYLFLSNNEFTRVPEQLKKMTNLKTLNLAGNRISREELLDLQSILKDTNIIY